MAKSIPTKTPNSPRPTIPTTPSKPMPQPRPGIPTTHNPGKRTEFGDKKSGGPGTNNTGAKK